MLSLYCVDMRGLSVCVGVTESESQEQGKEQKKRLKMIND